MKIKILRREPGDPFISIAPQDERAQLALYRLKRTIRETVALWHEVKPVFYFFGIVIVLALLLTLGAASIVYH